MNIAIILIGIVANYFAFIYIINKEPNGAMGLGLLAPAILIPYLIVVLALIGWVHRTFFND